MQNPKCPKCDSEKFDMNTIPLSNNDSVIRSIQCVSCGAIVGIMPKFHTEKAHNALIDKISRLHDSIRNLANAINQQTLQIQNAIDLKYR